MPSGDGLRGELGRADVRRRLAAAEEGVARELARRRRRDRASSKLARLARRVREVRR